MNRDQDIRLKTGTDRRLLLQVDGEQVPVRVQICFPWREPEQYLSLYDKDGKERGFVHRLADVDQTSRHALQAELDVMGFTLVIDRILELEKEIEIRSWRVMVKGAERSFQTELDEWPRDLSDGRLLIKDVSGDLYSIPNMESLDKESRKLLWALVE